MSSNLRVIYLAHPLTAPTREGIEANRARAAQWAAWAATTQNVSPVCSWIVLTGVLPETPENRRLGLEIDKAQVKVCEELWFVGGRVTSGMAIEASVAKKVVDLTHLGEWPPGYEPEEMKETAAALSSIGEQVLAAEAARNHVEPKKLGDHISALFDGLSNLSLPSRTADTEPAPPDAA